MKAKVETGFESVTLTLETISGAHRFCFDADDAYQLGTLLCEGASRATISLSDEVDQPILITPQGGATC